MEAEFEVGDHENSRSVSVSVNNSKNPGRIDCGSFPSVGCDSEQ